MDQTPHLLYISAKDSVCLMLFSLAVTRSISIDFFSCRYLDVSIPCVPHPYGSIAEVALGHLRINSYVQIPGAYRSLSRPSSAFEPSHPPNSSDYSFIVLQTKAYAIPKIINFLGHGFMNFNLYRPKRSFCASGRRLSFISK